MLAAVALVLVFLLQAPAPIVQSVDLAVPFQPVSFRQGDRDQIAYELHVTNFQRSDVVVTGVRVDSNRGPLIESRRGVTPSHHPAGIAQRPSRSERACAWHARGDQFLDSAA